MQWLDRLKQKLLAKPQTGAYVPLPRDVWGQSPRDLPLWNFNIIRMMLWDPTVRLGLAMREAPLCNAQFAYQDGDKWVSGIKADREDVAEFVLQQLQRLWRFDLHKILKAQVWGWCGAEITYRQCNGRVEFDSLLTRHAADVRALCRETTLAGVRFRRVQAISLGHVDVMGGKAFWHAFMPEDGSFYGHSVLRGCYSSWADKWFDGMALDVRRLFAHKDAYGGVDMTYPGGKTEINGVDVPNQDVARMIAEQIKAGGVTTRPSDIDPVSGKQRWELVRATIPASPTHIFEYPKELDVEILRGMEIPDDVLTSENGGAWEGKKVPAQAFFTGLNKWGNLLLGDIVKQLIEPLVWLNWGRAEEFEATLKPLGLQSGQEQQGDKPNGGGGMVNPFAPQGGGFGGGGFGGGGRQQMALDPTEAVGMGVLSAAELVKAARTAMRMASDKTGDGPGQWITIGAQKSGDGEKHGGVPVKVLNGKIIAGPAKFVGTRIKQIAERDQPDSRLHQEIRRGAEDWRVNKRDLKEAVDHVWAEKREAITTREKAKQRLREIMGLTQADANRLENAGKDYTAIKGFDVKARQVAGELSELGIGGGYEGGSNADDTDYSSLVWELLKEGRIEPPARHDPDIIDEAANLVIKSRPSKHKQPSEEDADYVPFGLRSPGDE